MSFADRRRADSEGIGMDGKYIPRGVISAEFVWPDVRLSPTSAKDLILSTTNRLLRGGTSLHFMSAFRHQNQKSYYVHS